MSHLEIIPDFVLSVPVQGNVIPPPIANNPHQVPTSNLSSDHLNFSYQSSLSFDGPLLDTFGGSDPPSTHNQRKSTHLLDAADVWPSLPEYPNGLDLDQFEAEPSTMQASLQDQISLSLDDLFSPNFATSTSSLSGAYSSNGMSMRVGGMFPDQPISSSFTLVPSPLVRPIPEIDYDFFGGRWDVGNSLR